MTIMTLWLASGCSFIDTISGRSAQQAQELYDGLYNQLVSATTFDSTVTDYDLTLNVVTTGDTYRFTLTVDQPRVAMRNVEVMVVDSNALSDPENGTILTRGLMDETIHLYPNQVYTDLNALYSVEVEGSINTLPQTLRVMVSYMDESGSTTYKQFFLFEINDIGIQILQP